MAREEEVISRNGNIGYREAVSEDVASGIKKMNAWAFGYSKKAFGNVGSSRDSKPLITRIERHVFCLQAK